MGGGGFDCPLHLDYHGEAVVEVAKKERLR